MTKTLLAKRLGISIKTLRNHELEGFEIARDEKRKVLIDENIKGYIKYIDDKIKALGPALPQPQVSIDNDENEDYEYWKGEKLKEQVRRLRIENAIKDGRLLNYAELTLLASEPLMYVRNKMKRAASECRRRRSDFTPAQLKTINDVTREMLENISEGIEETLVPRMMEIVKQSPTAKELDLV